MLSDTILANLQTLLHDESFRFVLLLGGLAFAVILALMGFTIARLMEADPIENDLPCHTAVQEQYQATAGDPRRI